MHTHEQRYYSAMGMYLLFGVSDVIFLINNLANQVVSNIMSISLFSVEQPLYSSNTPLNV
jgi:hypothetical protein